MEQVIETPENKWLEIVRQRYVDYMTGMRYQDQIQPVTMTRGKRYAKIIIGNYAHSFIAFATGDIFKCAGWAAPAKHARGNIFSDQKGQEAFGDGYYIRYL